MKLKGILDFSLGNFLCLRGFAPMDVLQNLSAPDESFQRIPDKKRLSQIGQYLKKGELVFFPEVILCVALNDEEIVSDKVAALFEAVQRGESSKASTFAHNLRLSTTVQRSKGMDDIRSVQFYQTATLDIEKSAGAVFSRIDGNHRLAATKDEKVLERSTPFCLILCRNTTEFNRFSRSLFHNINFKQEPLTMEKNLELILNDAALFSDETLKTDPSFGWPYYHARKLFPAVDYDYLRYLKPIINRQLRTFLLEQFSFLEEKEVLGKNENAIKRLKEALGKVNSLFEKYPALQATKNCGLLSTLIYFQLQAKYPVESFIRWVLENHLHLIENSHASDLIEIFNKILESRKRTLFVSMPFNKPIAENHYKIIERVCNELSEAYCLRPALKVQRVDWFHDGTSYEIEDKICDMIMDCGYLIGNLTYCNPNVYHEIGLIMGKAKAAGYDTANMLLFLDESVEVSDRYVGFNLTGIKQVRFTETEEFGKSLKKNIAKFFQLEVTDSCVG